MANETQRQPDMHPDRDQLFGNEGFAIGMLQAVSGGSVVAALAQLDAIRSISGNAAFLVFITGSAFALLCAVLAAYLRHQYKMWDVKQDPTRANIYLRWMRRTMLVSVVLVILSILQLVASFWLHEFCG